MSENKCPNFIRFAQNRLHDIEMANPVGEKQFIKGYSDLLEVAHKYNEGRKFDEVDRVKFVLAANDVRLYNELNRYGKVSDEARQTENGSIRELFDICHQMNINMPKEYRTGSSLEFDLGSLEPSLKTKYSQIPTEKSVK